VTSELYRIYSNFTPLVKSGEAAEINVSENLSQGATALLHASGPTIKLSVQGPQTSLTEDDISGVYPAPGTTDSSDDYLPHIALTRRTLPWERRGPADGAPWLALLVIRQADLSMRFNPIARVVDQNVVAKQTLAIPVASSAPKPTVTMVAKEETPLTAETLAKAADVVKVTSPAAAEIAAPAEAANAISPAASKASAQAPSGDVLISAGDAATKIAVELVTSAGNITPRSIQVKDLASSDAATRTQLLTIPGITDATPIQAINIPASTLQQILPSAADLKLLCHVKEVVEDGESTFTSIVVSGRLPDAGDMTTAPPQRHAALLVSLEHRDDIYARLNKGGAINLIVLHSWTFVPSKGGDFREVCQMIGYHPNGGVLRFGNTPSGALDPSKALSGGFGNLVDNAGYLVQPLDHAEVGGHFRHRRGATDSRYAPIRKNSRPLQPAGSSTIPTLRLSNLVNC
jgi:hypothetical protein